MPEFLKLKLPAEAREMLFANIAAPLTASEWVESTSALGRVAAEDVLAPHPLPDFPRSTVDGYAVRARDTHGAGESLPAYLTVIGEIPMGSSPEVVLGIGECALIHTGGMLPGGSDAIVMLEFTQRSNDKAGDRAEIEVLRPVAAGENTIRVGEDVAFGSVVIEKGQSIRAAEIGGLMALGILRMRVVEWLRIGLIATGDEVVEPSSQTRPGQVRDVNTSTLTALIEQAGAIAVPYGILPDDKNLILAAARKAVSECDAVIITAGSSASSRDTTAEVIDSLGAPGVLVHGINTRPGKPTILGSCGGKAVLGLPGNPVSALVNGYLFVLPLLDHLFGRKSRPVGSVQARLTMNLSSQAGREDWWPVKLQSARADVTGAGWLAEPVHGKSNLIFTLARADGLICVPADATGLGAGEIVEVRLLR